MSCNDDGPSRRAPDRAARAAGRGVGELPALLGDDVELTAEPGGRLRGDDPDGDRVGVVDECDAGRAPRVLVGRRSTATSRRRRSRSTLEPARRSARSCTSARRASTAAHSCVGAHCLRGPLARARARRPRSSTRSPTRPAAASSSGSGARPRRAGEIAGAAARDAPGRREAPRGAGGRRSRARRARRAAGRVPAHARAVRGRGRGGCTTSAPRGTAASTSSPPGDEPR